MRPVPAFAAAAALAASPAFSQADPARSLAEFIKPLMAPPSPYDGGVAWDGLDANRAVRWGAGPVMSDRASPDGNFFARPGMATLGGRQVQLVASGARSMVFSVYIRDTAPLIAPDALTAGLKQAGFGATLARCPLDANGPAPRRWYRLTAAGKRPAFLYAGPLQSGGGGYTLYLADLPPMTQAEARLYTDDCAGSAPGAPGPGAARPTTGQAGIVAVIEGLMRPAGAPAGIAWAGLAATPVVAWKGGAAMKMTNPWTDAGQDNNPRLLEGEFKTATTRMVAVATGDDRAASRFLLRDGRNLPTGAVLAGLARDGYSVTPIRCGKVYTQTSQVWFRIAGPGKQPAILYRGEHIDGGIRSEDYGLRLDNLAPPMEAGQSAPAGGRCPAPGF